MNSKGENMETTIYFSKMRDGVKIPSKKDENAGYDIYANFEEDSITIMPHETVMIPTGLVSMFDKEFFVEIMERGSTGSKGMGRRCGVIDSNYRGEWFIAITNHNTKALCITKDLNKKNNDYVTYYPYSKAIAQAVILPVPKTNVVELELSELLSNTTDRGDGKLGSSGK